MILKNQILYESDGFISQKIGTIEEIIHRDTKPWLIEINLLDNEEKNILKTMINHKRFSFSSKIYENNDIFIGSISKDNKYKISPYGTVLTIIIFILLLATLPIFVSLESYKAALPILGSGFIIIPLIFILYYYIGPKKFYIFDKDSQILFEVEKKISKPFLVYDSNNFEVIAEINETGRAIPTLTYKIDFLMENQGRKLLILGFLLQRYFEKKMLMMGFGNY